MRKALFHSRCRRIAACLSALLIGGLATTADAQTYPNRPIRLVVPFPAGGSVDLVPRVIGPIMSERLGQQVVVENRAGATGKIAIGQVKRSEPDGYTFAIVSAVTHGLSPAVSSNVGYDPVKDLVPVVLIAEAPNAFFVNPKVPATTMREMADYVKRSGGKVAYGSGGPGTGQHIMANIFLHQAGLPTDSAIHVPYNGEAPALNDLVGGQVQFMITSGNKALVDRGDLRILASTGRKRWFRYPDVPTATELGFDGVYYTGWVGIKAPLGTPQEVVDKVNEAANFALQNPQVQKVLADNGFELRGGPPSVFHDHLVAEATRWKKQIGDIGLKID
jgi:tripartite-type tricarboxylate transporter receptor subunit TctC